MAQPERLSRLLKSVNRAMAQSHDAPFRNGPAYVRCNSGVTIWTAAQIEDRDAEVGEQADEARETAADAVDKFSVAAPGEVGEFIGAEDAGQAQDGVELCSEASVDAVPTGHAIDQVDAVAAASVEPEPERSASPSHNDDLTMGANALAPAPTSHGAFAPARPASALTHKMLGAIETQLAMEIGPVARVLVARYAKHSADIASLGTHLEEHISSEPGRIRFKKALLSLSEAALHGGDADTTQASLRTLQLQQESVPAVAEQRAAPTPEQVHAAGAKLATYLGPIAHVIAKREAQSVVDLDTLLQRLTESIRSDADRNGFRLACRDIRQP